MFQLARCPDCGTLQLHRGLDEVEARECRDCEEPVAAGDWQVEEEHGSFGAARDRLRRLRDRTPTRAGGLASGPPVPSARLPLEEGDPARRRALADLLRGWADAGEPVPEDRVVEALVDLGAAHLLGHLLREGYLERLQAGQGAGDEPVYRVDAQALPDDPPG